MQQYAMNRCTAQDAHSIEKHLLSCSFCSEAMEGLEAFQGKGGFQTDVDLLKHRLRLKVDSGERKTPYLMLAIAASIVIVSGLAIYLFSLSDTGMDSSRIAVLDTTKIEKRVEREEDGIINEINRASGSLYDTVVTNKDLEGELDRLERKENVVLEEIRDEEADELLVERETNAKNAQPPTPDEIEIVEYEETISNADYAVAAGTVAPIEEEKLGKGKGEKEEDVLSEDIQEEVIVAAATKERIKKTMKRKARTSESSLKDSAPAKAPVALSSASQDSDAAPIDGMVAYKKYLARNLKYPEKAKENEISGKVSVSFTVNEKGKPSGFKILKGLGYGCDEEAIRLIKEGPEWSPKIENGLPVESKQTLVVEFRK